MSDNDEEDFLKVADLVPDIHYLHTILKVHSIEAVITLDSG